MWFGKIYDLVDPLKLEPVAIPGVMIDFYLCFSPAEIANLSNEEIIGALRYWQQEGTNIYEIAHSEAQKDHLLKLKSKEKKKSISQGLRTKVFERDRYRCIECGTWENLTVDHKIPESKGGSTTLENLQTLCRSCNSKKGIK